MNIRKIQKYQLETLINIHDDYINCLLCLNDGRIASASFDTKINIYNKNLLTIDIQINEHLKSVTYITQLKNNNLVSCSEDKTINIIKIIFNKYVLIQTLLEHHWGINKIIELSNGQNLVSGSDDKTIIIWKKFDKMYYEKSHVLNGNEKWIDNLIEIKSSEILSTSSQNETITIWDIDKHTKIHEIKNIKVSNSNQNLFLIKKYELIIGGKEYIYIMDVFTKKILKTYKCDFTILCFLNLNNNKIFISGDNNGDLRQFYYNNKELKNISKINTFSKGYINTITLFHGFKIVTGSNDKLIKIFS